MVMIMMMKMLQVVETWLGREARLREVEQEIEM